MASREDEASIKADLHELRRELEEFRSSFEKFRELYLSSRSDLWEKSRSRWRGDEADTSLTWGSEWTGDAFIDLVLKRYKFNSETRMIEIGPGYGRLLDTIKKRKLPYARYLGLDISAPRVERLNAKYADDPKVSFAIEDAEKFAIEEEFDICISSATFSHFFPNFLEVASNIRRHLKVGGVLCFDVSEGSSVGGFQHDGQTFGRCHNRAELSDIFHDSHSQFGDLWIEQVTHGNDGVTGEPVTMLFVFVKRIR